MTIEEFRQSRVHLLDLGEWFGGDSHWKGRPGWLYMGVIYITYSDRLGGYSVPGVDNGPFSLEAAEVCLFNWFRHCPDCKDDTTEEMLQVAALAADQRIRHAANAGRVQTEPDLVRSAE